MSVPVYIQAGYAFRAGARLKQGLDANKIGEEIAALRDERSVIPAPAVVEAARPEASAMHDHFEWDDTAAADQWRLDQARYLLRSIVTVYADTRSEEEIVSQQRVFVARYPDGNDAEQAGEYQMIAVQTAPALPTPRRVIERAAPVEPVSNAVFLAPPPAALLTPERERALHTLRTWANAYGTDPYFAGVVAAIRLLG